MVGNRDACDDNFLLQSAQFFDTCLFVISHFSHLTLNVEQLEHSFDHYQCVWPQKCILPEEYGACYNPLTVVFSGVVILG